jgi:hypothetical protein
VGGTNGVFFPRPLATLKLMPCFFESRKLNFFSRVGWRVLTPPICQPILDSELSKARLGAKGRNPRILKPAIFSTYPSVPTATVIRFGRLSGQKLG